MKLVQKLWGLRHPESRRLVVNFQKSMTNSRMSISEERTQEILKHKKQVPILNKCNYQLDEKVVQDAKISPLLVRKRSED